MSISIVSNFKYQGPLANFERDQYATLSDMLNVNENILPPVFIGVCLETKKAYLYNVENDVDPVLGKWREIANGSDVNDATITIKKNGTAVDSFTANQATAKDINITIAASDLSDVTATATEINYLSGVTGNIQERMDLEEHARIEEDNALADEVSGIKALIPSDAKPSNQLADKAFVNSSIATNTATFRGTFNSTDDLPTKDIDENDYAFVVTTDAAGNTLYNRYKYSNNRWVFEYTLNNSSFTAQQWAAINSTITAADKTGYDSHVGDSTIHVTQADKNNWNNKVTQTGEASKIYGTDNSGNQTTYNYDSFGKVDDVKVGTESVVVNKIATLGTMAEETASNYRKSADQDTIDNDLSSRITQNTSNLNAEIDARDSADSVLEGQIYGMSNAVGGEFGQKFKYNYTYKIDPDTELVNIADTDTVVKAIGKLDNALGNEVTRATTAEGTLSTRISAEEEARIAEQNSLRTQLADEIGRATGVEGALQTNVATSLIIQKNGTNVATYQPSSNTDATVNITIAVSDVTDLTATSTELNTLHGLTASTTELNYTTGVTSAIQTQLNNRVEKNDAIASATHTKITYDTKGLVTNGSDLLESDIPQLSESKITNLVTHLNAKQNNLTSENAGEGISITKTDDNVLKISNTRTTIPWGNLTGTLSNQTDLQDALDTKLDKNVNITGATHTKITYDEKGLVTSGTDLAEADIPGIHLEKIVDVTASAAELNYVDGVTAPIQTQITNLSSALSAEVDRSTTVDNTQGTYISNIQAVIPTAATSGNQLADKKFVNDLIQSTAADFRGSWDTYADVPSDPSLYPEDDEGNRKPGKNDYIIVQRDEAQDGGTWRYKYTGEWDTDGKSGWTAEYEINANPLTADQIAALDSGITDTLVAQITTNANNITSLTNSKQNNITGAASTVTTNNLNPSVVVISNANGKIDASTITIDELNNLFGTTSNLQTQLDNKQGSLTAAQMAAVDSGVTKAKVNNYDAHIANTTIHVTSADKSNWNAKQEALNEAQMNAVNSTATQSKIESYSNHIVDTDIHVTTTDKSVWNAKQNAITGAASTVTDTNLSASKAVVSDANGKITASSITSTELGYLSGATENIQERLDNMIIFRTWS